MSLKRKATQLENNCSRTKTNIHMPPTMTSSPIHTAGKSSPTLTGIPDELLLIIGSFVAEDYPPERTDCKNLATVCKKLLPIARECMMARLTIYRKQLPGFVPFLLQYPDLPLKVKELTIISPAIKRRCCIRTFRPPTCHSNPDCISEYRMIPNEELRRNCCDFIARWTTEKYAKKAMVPKTFWTTALKQGDEAAYLEMVLALLTNLKKLRSPKCDQGIRSTWAFDSGENHYQHSPPNYYRTLYYLPAAFSPIREQTEIVEAGQPSFPIRGTSIFAAFPV